MFFAAFVIFYALLGSKPEAKVGNLKQDASMVIQQVVSEETPYKVVDGDELNTSRLGHLKNYTYDELKRIFRTEGDFCIYIEDDSGNLVLINDSYRGIGSPNIHINGVPCSQK